MIKVLENLSKASCLSLSSDVTLTLTVEYLGVRIHGEKLRLIQEAPIASLDKWVDWLEIEATDGEALLWARDAVILKLGGRT